MLLKKYGPPIAFSTSLISGSILVSMIIDFVVPNPYMDEIFHVDQVRRYCQGRFDEWNDKITTPPALYFVSYSIWKILDLFGIEFDCGSIIYLRLSNVIFLVPLYFVICDILRIHWNSRTSFTSATGHWTPIILYSTALNLCMFPVLYFTAFLYYTDILSTLFVTAAYLLYLRGWKLSSSVFGASACAVRQTNIIWLAFCFYLSIMDVFVRTLSAMDAKARIGRQKRDDSESNDDDMNEMIYETDTTAFVNGLRRFWNVSRWSDIRRFVLNCIVATWNYVLVGIGFFGFIVWNDGVVLGDRSAHQACAHFVQFLYFLLFTSVFGFAVSVSKSTIRSVLTFVLKRPILAVLGIFSITLIIYGFTYDHPYLLADNRHYTFYIWRRWFMRHPSLKYVLAPIYLGSILAVSKSLSIPRNGLWTLGFYACVFLVTVPNRLMEFRYFILPFFFWRLRVDPISKQRLRLEFLCFLSINVITISLFLLKPFQWPNSDDVQRFMW